MEIKQQESKDFGKISPLLLVFLSNGTEGDEDTPCSVKLVVSYNQDRGSYIYLIEKNFHGEKDSFQFTTELIRETLFLSLKYSSSFLSEFRPKTSHIITADDQKELSQEEITSIFEGISPICQEWLDLQEN